MSLFSLARAAPQTSRPRPLLSTAVPQSSRPRPLLSSAAPRSSRPRPLLLCSPGPLAAPTGPAACSAAKICGSVCANQVDHGTNAIEDVLEGSAARGRGGGHGGCSSILQDSRTPGRLPSRRLRTSRSPCSSSPPWSPSVRQAWSTLDVWHFCICPFVRQGSSRLKRGPGAESTKTPKVDCVGMYAV